MNKYKCIKYLISQAGYTEISTSDIRYKKLYISSEDTDKTIMKKISFAKKGLNAFPEYDVIYSDIKGRKIHLSSSELEKIYRDIEFFIQYRFENEFNDITRYKNSTDIQTE